MNDLANSICEIMKSSEFVKQHFPILSDWGLKDEDVMVHSLGCSIWNLLGHTLGYMAVLECPAPSAIGADIRSDSIWFCKKNRNPEVIIEFERFDGTMRGQKKLEEKTRNLMEASQRCENLPTVLVLSVWNEGVVSVPDTEGLINCFRNGFKSSTGLYVNPPRSAFFIFSRFIFEKGPDHHLRIRQLKCSRLT